MDYIPLEKNEYFSECDKTICELGYKLVELQVVPQKGNVHITAVITHSDSSKDIGVADCSKVHRVLQPKLISLLNVSEDNVYMEVCSPGLERNIKNAAEFGIFKGREIRVWDKNVSDWVRGFIVSADETQVTLKVEEGTEKSVAFTDIAKAKFIHL